jgi:hypothetical protein
MKSDRANPLAVLCTAVLLAGLVFTGWKAWYQAESYERTTLSIIEQLDTTSRLESLGHQALEWLSLGMYQGDKDEIARLSDLKSLQETQASSVKLASLAFLGLIPPLLMSAWWSRRDLGDVAYVMLGAAIIALVVGLSAPVLWVQASKSLPLLGETVFQFESRGILATILALRDSGNTWLALLLLFFSVLLPVAKTVLAGVTFFARTHHWSLRGFALSRHIGKWSMADVFVVAILVSFFAANHETGITRAQVQAGLYFFAAYVVLSLAASQVIDRVIARRSLV